MTHRNDSAILVWEISISVHKSRRKKNFECGLAQRTAKVRSISRISSFVFPHDRHYERKHFRKLKTRKKKRVC